MFKKTLLATSALVVASSMALAAGQHGKLSHAQAVAKAKFVTHHAMMQHMPGVIFDRNHGTPMAVKFQMSQVKPGAHGIPGKLTPSLKYSTLSKSKNALFLSYFGWFAGNVNVSYNSSFSYCISYNSQYTQCLNHEHIHYSSQLALTQMAGQPFTGVSAVKDIEFGAEQYSGTGGGRAAIYSDAGGVPGGQMGKGGTFSAPPSFNGLCCGGLQTVGVKPGALTLSSTYWVVLSGPKTGSGRVVWNGQDSNFTAAPTGEAYNANEHVKYKDTYRTTRSGHQSTYSASYSTGTHGWIHTSSYSFGEQQAAFALK